MREYILTQKERTIIAHYLETGEKLEGFKVLLHRLKNRNPTIIQEDLRLISEFLKKNTES